MAACLAAVRQFTPPEKEWEDFFSREGAKARRRQIQRRMAACLAAARQFTPPEKEWEDFFSREGAKARRRQRQRRMAACLAAALVFLQRGGGLMAPSAYIKPAWAPSFQAGRRVFVGSLASIVKEWIMDIVNSYQEDYRIRLNEAGPGGRLRLHALFDYLQDIASLHATALGIGLPVLLERQLTWVLSRVAFRMDEYPLYGDTVRVSTYTRGFERLFALRQFELHSLQTGRRLGVASSNWLLLRSDKLRPVAPATAFPALADIDEQRPVFFPRLDKLPDCVVVGQLQEHRIGQFQIDWNMHVNNSYYAVYARDWLAARLGRPVRLVDMQINFNAALLFGDMLRCLGEADERQFRVDGVAADGRNVFQAAGHFVVAEDAVAG